MTKCIFCGGKASLLCDSWIGWERMRGAMAKDGYTGVAEGPGFNVPLRYRVIHTCDAPLCRACAVPDGIFHARMKHGAFSDSIDYCPGHSRGDLRQEIGGLGAEAFRAKWRAKVRTMQQQPAEQFGRCTELLEFQQ